MLAKQYRKLGMMLAVLALVMFPSVSVKSATTVDVGPMQYYYTSFTTTADNVIVHVKVEVVSGPAIDVLLVDEENYNSFVQQIQSGHYQVYAYLAYRNVRSVDRDVELGAKGQYYLILINNDISETSTVSYDITSSGSGNILGGIIILAVIVIIPIAIYLYKKRK